MDNIKSVVLPWHFITLFLVLLIAIPSASSAQYRVRRSTVVVNPPPSVVTPIPPVRRGTVVAVAPTGARVITYGSVSYRYVNGVFYQPRRGGFVVVTPPVGIRVSILPVGYQVVRVGGRRYFHYHGTYYVAAGRGYKVVATPV